MNSQSFGNILRTTYFKEKGEENKGRPPINPDTAAPMWKSTSIIFSTEEGSNRVDVSLFSTAKITPSEV